MSIQIELDVKGTAKDFREEAVKNPKLAADCLGGEIAGFESYLVGQGMEPLARFELHILREYLGYKLVGKGGEKS